MGEGCRTYGGEERGIQGFGGKTEVKIPLERPRHRWKYISNIDLHKV